MSIGDFLDCYFENDLIKAHLAGSGIIGTGLGVYSPGTAYVLLHHYMGDIDGGIGAWGFARKSPCPDTSVDVTHIVMQKYIGSARRIDTKACTDDA